MPSSISLPHPNNQFVTSSSSSLNKRKSRILIIAPLDLQISGNNTTVNRLGKLLASSEFEIDVKSCCSNNNNNHHHHSQTQQQIPETFEYDCVIGLHALRCAKWLLATEGEYLIREMKNKSFSTS